MYHNLTGALLILLSVYFLFSCSEKNHKKTEELTLAEFQQQNDSLAYSIKESASFQQLSSSPNSVVLTGIDRFRLITLYKINPKADRNIQYHEGTSYYYNYGIDEEDEFRYFMPGIDIINGYNMINVGHYDMEKDTLTYFFQNPVLVKTLYFPGIKKDSLDKKRVIRNYYMVSVYDEDTNNDSIINNKDLRKIYHFDISNTKRTQLIPQGYSAIKSTYDYKNDVMYIYTRFDENGNGIPEKNEPINIFWIRLSEPTAVRKII